MKQGRTLTGLAEQLEHQLESKRDYIARPDALTMTEGLSLSGLPEGEVGITDLAHSQIAEFTGIPGPYYKRMKVSWPVLLSMNVNTWMKEQGDKRRLIRTLDGSARAMLSDKYRPIDNYELADAVLPSISEAGAKLESCDLTERKMYLKAVFPKIEGEIKRGDPVQLGLVVSNSEVGCGSVSIQPLIYRLVCLNGMIAPDYSLRKYHAGRLNREEDITAALFSSETLAADNHAFFLKVRDLVKGVLQQEVFDRILNGLRETTERKIERDPVQSIDFMAASFGLSKEERGGVLRHLVEGGDLSQWGVINAVTRTAQDVDSYDRATELETLGGKIAVLNKRDWQAIAVDGEYKEAA